MLNAFNRAIADRLSRQIPGLPLAPAEPRHLEEPRGRFRGVATWVASPRSTEEVAAIVRFAGNEGIGLQPLGGGTGLVGGQVTPEGPAPLVVSMARMNAIRGIYPEEYTLVAEAGATVADIQAAADAAGRLFPLSYASQSSAQIGAGLAVNSGGLNVLRYGMARDLCLGVEAVLPDGSVMHGLKRLRKDNTGYDIRHLLIGSEGTLGIITAAALRLAQRPAQVATAFLAVPDPGAALGLLTRVLDLAGEVVSAFELMSGEGLAFLAETHPDTRQPFAVPPEWSVLVEIGTGAATDAAGILETLFSQGLEAGLVSDGFVASGERQRAEFWAVRETIPAANRAIGAVASHDISLPLSEIPGFIARTGPEIGAIGPFRINVFGHLGDGNLHYNVFPPKGRSPGEFRDLAPDVTRLVHDRAVASGGSFSAEHGIGRLKPAELLRYGDPARLSAMRAIKSALDPLGIMNPGAVLPEES